MSNRLRQERKIERIVSQQFNNLPRFSNLGGAVVWAFAKEIVAVFAQQIRHQVQRCVHGERIRYQRDLVNNSMQKNKMPRLINPNVFP